MPDDEPAGDPGTHGSAYWRKAARRARRETGGGEETGSDLRPLREIRRRDSEPEGDGDGAGTARWKSTFRRHPARWLGSLAALVSLGAVAVGIVWTWWHSAGPPGPSGSSGPSSGSSSGSSGPSSGPSTGWSGCDSGCAPVDDACNKACDDTAHSCFQGTCGDTSCGPQTCYDTTCNDSSCGSSSCSGAGSGATHLVQVTLAHLVTGPPLLFEARRRVSVPARAVVRLITWYQRRVSAELGVSCRYTPSCSRYGLAAIERYGLLDGARLAADRIHRCRPAVPVGTSDPLPGH